ncbi:hypothetical protein QR98_0012200 [Sarcoptes scabiei]|uniref:Uncharacterized protein n=1 Tax=Sarcoptes scabiei TaxID=52283 RepID=A0A131ZVE3_SARSC|nr:hypothetical protein QR98_0012200 [Sarcoptes scabiei]
MVISICFSQIQGWRIILKQIYALIMMMVVIDWRNKTDKRRAACFLSPIRCGCVYQYHLNPRQIVLKGEI